MNCLFFLLYIIHISNSATPSYIRSIFGHPGTDEIENEYVDGIEILETGLPHPKLTPVSEGHYTSQPIDPDDYPWPGHPFKGQMTWDLLKEESTNILSRYRRTNFTQEEVHWHPAGAKQWYTTDEELAAADRVKIRFTLQPKYHSHFLPGFAPPGEVITIEIPDPLVNNLKMVFNLQTREFNGKTNCNTRLDSVILRDLPLDRKVNKVALPYGGTISFYYSGEDPVEINVSGVIPQPYFYYGMTSDEEWENDLSKRPGPYAFFDTGNLVHMVPSKFIRGTTRLNDCMKYWRSAVQISHTTARDVSYYNNERYGRILNPCVLKYDTFVPAGAAVAFVGGNFCHFPCDWISNTVVYDNAVDNPWGTIHEINHHHQENWGKTQESGEMSNNAVSLVVYAKTNICSSKRSNTGWPRYTYASYELNDEDTYGLQRYSTILHFFGTETFKEFVKADQAKSWYSQDAYGIPGGEMLRASRVTNRNMRYHWNFHGTSDETLGQNALAELERLNLKPFHPVTNVYAVGAVVDGVGFRTARAYRINPFPQTIDFVTAIVQRENKEWFGDFEFHSATFERGRETAWIEQSKGVYQLTPKSDILEDEEVNVTYLDKSTNEEHIVICQFTQKYSNTISNATRYGFIPNENNDLMKAYKYVAENDNVTILQQSYRNDGIFFSDYENRNVNTWIAVQEGRFSPPEDANYTFSITADTEAAFYLSEEPLQNHPDLDADKLTNYQKGTQMSFDNGNKSRPMFLKSDKIYYFKYIVFPLTWGSRKGRGWCGYKKNNQGNWDTVPASWMKFKDIDAKTLFDNQFVPNFERIYLMDQWNGQSLVINDQSKWLLYKYPKGEVRIKTNDFQGQYGPNLTPTEAITDGDFTTEYRVNWWSGHGVVPFPHVFEIDMGETNHFSAIRIGGTGNPNLFGMNNDMKIYLAPYNYSASDASYQESNYSIDHEESLIWEGVLNPQINDVIELGKDYSGRYLKIVSLNNTLAWKDNWAGRTSISAVEVGYAIHSKKVYPITGTRYFAFRNRWDERRGGCYYNGKGFTGYARGQAPSRSGDHTNLENSKLKIKIPINKKEFGVIGDYYPEIGRAIVRLDGKIIGTIGEKSYDVNNDKRRLTKASRSYKTLLFYCNSLDPSVPHTVTIEVTERQITLSGILTQQMIVDYFTDNGTYENILEHEFDIEPGEFDWIPATPTPKPTENQPIESPNTQTEKPIEISETPIATPLPPPEVDNIDSDANIFEITDDGFKSKEDTVEIKEIKIDKTSTTIKTVTFSKKEISITESGNFNSEKPLYFVPSVEGSTISISKNLTQSNIGVSTEKSPVVKLFKGTNPLSILNNVTRGSIVIDIPEKDDEKGEDITQINLKEANNYQGSFSLIVPSTIKVVSFLTVSLFKESSLGISSNSHLKTLQLTSDEEPVIRVENQVNVAPSSKSTLSNMDIVGTLEIYDDSSLTLDKNSQLAENSKISVILQHAKSYNSQTKPIIYFEESVKSLPSKITLSTKGVSKIEITDLPLIGSKSFPSCSDLYSRIELPAGKEASLSANCKVVNDMTLLTVTANEKEDGKQSGGKKSNIGVIIGVVVAVVVVFAIVVVVVIVVRHKKTYRESSDIDLNL